MKKEYTITVHDESGCTELKEEDLQNSDYSYLEVQRNTKIAKKRNWLISIATQDQLLKKYIYDNYFESDGVTVSGNGVGNIIVSETILLEEKINYINAELFKQFGVIK